MDVEEGTDEEKEEGEERENSHVVKDWIVIVPHL